MSLPRIQVTLDYNGVQTIRSIVFGLEYEIFLTKSNTTPYGIRLCPTQDNGNWSPDCILYFSTTGQGIYFQFYQYGPYKHMLTHKFNHAKYSMLSEAGKLRHVVIDGSRETKFHFNSGSVVVSDSEEREREPLVMYVEGVERFVKDCNMH